MTSPTTREHQEQFFRHVFLPSFLLFMCTPSLLMLVTVIKDYQGNMAAYGKHILSSGLVQIYWTEIWQPLLVAVSILTLWTVPYSVLMIMVKSFRARSILTACWIAATTAILKLKGSEIMAHMNIMCKSSDYSVYGLVIGFAVFEFLLLKYVPGRRFYGPVTPMNNRPIYKQNGMTCFVITLVTVATLSLPSSPLHTFDASLIYLKFKEIIAACNVVALTLCNFLTVKAIYFPTNSDVRNDHNVIMLYYWGRELHPQALGESVKQFTNCRFGMMAWACCVLGFALAQHQMYGTITNGMLVNTALQIIYIAKFFHWESGYFATMDMQEDRAGFYICWGCLCWITALYTSSTLALVEEQRTISQGTALTIFVLGCVSIFLNYSADAERKLVRETQGKCLIWGKEPTLIVAKHTTADGVEHESLLLASGFWGISRHSHYLFELMAAFLWSCPASIQWLGGPGLASIVPLAYFIFLTILLFDRAVRDDKRCSKKYGAYWDEYRKLVPYKIIPGVF